MLKALFVITRILSMVFATCSLLLFVDNLPTPAVVLAISSLAAWALSYFYDPDIFEED